MIIFKDARAYHRNRYHHNQRAGIFQQLAQLAFFELQNKSSLILLRGFHSRNFARDSGSPDWRENS